jgi:hypothetical protein
MSHDDLSCGWLPQRSREAGGRSQEPLAAFLV